MEPPLKNFVQLTAAGGLPVYIVPAHVEYIAPWFEAPDTLSVVRYVSGDFHWIAGKATTVAGIIDEGLDGIGPHVRSARAMEAIAGQRVLEKNA